MKSVSRSIIILIICVFVAIPCLFFWCGTACVFMAYQSTQIPNQFKEDVAKRDVVVIQRLKDIRTIQELHRDMYQTYCSNWADLINFVKTDSVITFVTEGYLTDEQLAMGLSSKKALNYLSNPVRYAKEIQKFNLDVNRYAKKTSVLDGISPKISRNLSQWIDRIQYIPIEEAKNDTFELKTGQVIDNYGHKKPLFEAKVAYEVYLRGLDVAELNDKIKIRKEMDKYPGLQIGNVEYDNNNAGNWE